MAGAVGPRGATGATGAPGATGAVGATGATGSPGAPGATGLAGATGATGAAGLAGATGAAGEAGPAGAPGIAGATGATGEAGPAGATGEAGPAGATGTTGLAGATGAPGTDGLAGATGATGLQGPAGLAGATGATGLQGPAGVDGAEGPEGPPGVIDFFYANVENDQGIVGSTIGNGTIGANNFGQTPFPATLTVTLEAGTYLLSWNAEVMRTTAGGSTPFYVRLHEGPRDAGTTYGFLRQRSTVENGPPGNMPDDPEFFALGDVIPFSGSVVLALAEGTRTFRLEYALSNSTTTSEALRAQHQRISLLRLE